MRTGLIGLLAAVALSGPALAQDRDIQAMAFSQRVIGVTGTDGDMGLRVVTDLLHNRPRILKVGDTDNGWVVKSVTADTATLAKDGATWRIGLKPGLVASTGEPVLTAVVPAPSPAVAADMEAGDVPGAQADGGTVEQIWTAMRTIAATSRDTNAVREYDNLEAQGPDAVVMGSVLPGGIGPNTPGATPDYISTTGYYLGKDAQGHFVFYRTLALFKAAGNTTPIE